MRTLARLYGRFTRQALRNNWVGLLLILCGSAFSVSSKPPIVFGVSIVLIALPLIGVFMLSPETQGRYEEYTEGTLFESFTTAFLFGVPAILIETASTLLPIIAKGQVALVEIITLSMTLS